MKISCKCGERVLSEGTIQNQMEILNSMEICLVHTHCSVDEIHVCRLLRRLLMKRMFVLQANGSEHLTDQVVSLVSLIDRVLDRPGCFYRFLIRNRAAILSVCPLRRNEFNVMIENMMVLAIRRT